jgi:hypothetical protein
MGSMTDLGAAMTLLVRDHHKIMEPYRAWMRAAVMSCTEPGSTSETHSGNPSRAVTAWTLPP